MPFIQGKAGKSPGNLAVKKERSSSVSLDRGGVVGLESKPKELVVANVSGTVTVTDDAPSLR